MKSLCNLILFFGWIYGIVLSKGIMTLVAIIIPLYSWYLVGEHYILTGRL